MIADMLINKELNQIPLSLIAKIGKWTFKWKMSSNPGPSKAAQEVIYCRKLKVVPHLSITFNSNPLGLCPAQMHLGLVLDSELTFNEHINQILSKVDKLIGLLRKFNQFFPRPSILTI